MTMHAAAPERAGGSATGSSPTQRMPDMDALYSRLAEADKDGDTKALAAWHGNLMASWDSTRPT